MTKTNAFIEHLLRAILEMLHTKSFDLLLLVLLLSRDLNFHCCEGGHAWEMEIFHAWHRGLFDGRCRFPLGWRGGQTWGGGKFGKNIVYHFPNKIFKNLLRIWLTRNLLVKPLTRVTIPIPDQPPWSFLDTSLLQYRKENLKVNAWINYNISICEKLGFGLHLILNTGYDLTTALGKF